MFVYDIMKEYDGFVNLKKGTIYLQASSINHILLFFHSMSDLIYSRPIGNPSTHYQFRLGLYS